MQTSRQQELQAEMDRIFSETWHEFAEQGLLYAGDFWQHDKEQQRILLQQWLHKEIAYSEAGTMRPVCTELEFGRGNGGLMPLEINGRRIFLNGKIDRIDKSGNAFYITDYKSSQAPKKAKFLDTNLQLPLYMIAADRLVAAKEGGTVTGGGYYVLNDGERKESFLFVNAQDGNLPGRHIRKCRMQTGTRSRLPI